MAVNVAHKIDTIFKINLLKKETMMQTKYLGGIALVALAITGCTATSPSNVASSTAPRMITNADKGNVWNDPSLFGPVPANLQAKGDKDCQNAGFKAATGYHPKGQDLSGKPYQDGAYYCIPK